MKTVTLFTVFFLFFNTNNTIRENIIIWQQDTKLHYSDFNAEPERDSPFNALTSCGIGYSVSIKNKTIHIKNEAVFDKKKSWIKSNDPSVLRHEQKHFDICEIYRRYFCLKLEQAKFTDPKKAAKIIDDLYEESMQKMSNLQEKYDAATDHSLNKPIQMQWNRTIDSILNASKNYEAVLIYKLP